MSEDEPLAPAAAQPAGAVERPRRRRGSKATDRGRLKIGDDWNAIRIIALSQSNPLKAIAEFVENSIATDDGQRWNAAPQVLDRRERQVYTATPESGEIVALPGADGRSR